LGLVHLYRSGKFEIAHIGFFLFKKSQNYIYIYIYKPKMIQTLPAQGLPKKSLKSNQGYNKTETKNNIGENNLNFKI